jgi:uncharacterized protein YybS (DUF2232 family)
MVFMDLLGKGCLRAVIAGSSLTFILFLLQRTLSVIGPLAGCIVPFPCVYFSIRSGRKVGYAIVALQLMGLLFLDRQESFFYLLQSVAISLAIPQFLPRGYGLSRTLLYTVGANSLLLIVFVITYGLFSPVDIDGQMQKAIGVTVAEIERVYRGTGLTGTYLQDVLSALRETEKIAYTIYPSLILIFCWLSAASTILLLRKALRGKGIDIFIESFSSFKNPDYLVWPLIAAGFTLVVSEGYLNRITLNILIVILFFYFIQGIAIVTYFHRKFLMSRFLLPIFYVLMVIQPMVMIPVTAIGLFDLWTDFRAPKQQENL